MYFQNKDPIHPGRAGECGRAGKGLQKRDARVFWDTFPNLGRETPGYPKKVFTSLSSRPNRMPRHCEQL